MMSTVDESAASSRAYRDSSPEPVPLTTLNPALRGSYTPE